MSDRDLLSLLGVLAAQGTLNNAGALLLCRRDVAHPVAVYQYRRTPGGEPTVIERLETPLLLTFSRLMELINARQNITPVNLPDGQQLQIKDFPDVPVRESTVNALIHGDHRLGSPIQIEHSPAVFSVRSPGPLVAGITPANIITHSSKPRYPVLTKAVRVLGLAEEVGQGIDRMYREMIAAGKEVPQIEESYEEVRVALLGGAPNTRITKYIATLPTEERQDTDTLLTIVRLCNKKTVTAQKMAPVMQRRVEEAEESLRRLSSEAIAMLERTRESARRAFPTYRFRGPALQALGRAVRYQRRTWDEIDRKVVEHVEDYGKINNRTLQRLFDVDVYQARSMLADLVQREVLVKRSGAERGPSVAYAPGGKFPGMGRQARKRESDDGTY
ncbi:MAG: ATP-binding protein [Egibacteraceae bacterium]